MKTLAYSGSLAGYNPLVKSKISSFIRSWLWTYKSELVDSSTRSGYYLIQAVKLLRDKYDISEHDFRVTWWGNIDRLNLHQVTEEKLDAFFEYTRYLPKKDSIDKLNKADLLFLPVERSRIAGRGTLFIPGKLFEYLNARKPILALCEDSDCKTILEKSRIAIFAPPDDPVKISSVLYDILVGKIDINSFVPNDAYIHSFSFQQKTKDLARVFDECLLRS